MWGYFPASLACSCGAVEPWGGLGQAVGGHALFGQHGGGPGGGVGGGADYELATGAEQGSSGFDHRRWWAEAAGGYQISATSVLLVFTEVLSGHMEDIDALRPPETGAVQFQESGSGQ